MVSGCDVGPANDYYKKNARFLILVSWRDTQKQGKDSYQLNLWPLYYITKDEDMTFWHSRAFSHLIIPVSKITGPRYSHL
jgi:hypothetical protein